MKRINTILLLALNVVLPIMAGSIGEVPESEVKTADPFILNDNGIYYLYGTRAGNPNKGFEAFSSKDLKNWKREGYVITTGRSLYWAPEVYKFDGKYYMYYSAGHQLYVAIANSPLGPFKDVSTEPMLELGVNMIDSSIFTDTLPDGKIQQWMFFVEENGGNRIYRCKLNADHVTADASTVQKVIEADKTYEKRVSYRCTEGPIVIKKGGRYFLMYSANTYNSIHYCVCVAFTSNLESNQWTKLSTNPILSYTTLDNQLYGTGHHGWFIDNDGQCRIVFHAYKNKQCVGTRRVYIGALNVSTRNISMNLSSPIISPKLFLGGYDMCDSVTTAVQAGTSICVDLDNDGYKDFVVAGTGRAHVGMQNNVLLYDSTTHRWKRNETPLQTSYRPALIPCDINLDGNMDILTFDTLGTNIPAVTTPAAIEREGLFLGDGNGNLTRQELSLIDSYGRTVDFNIIAPMSADVADFNNDGLPDIVLVGYRKNVLHTNVVLINRGKFIFEVCPWNDELELTDGIVRAYDFNNDGIMDFIVNGAIQNGSSPYSAIYQGLGMGKFLLRSANSLGIRNLANGTVQVADVNNDGFLDIFLQGSSSGVNSTTRFRQALYLNSCNTSLVRFIEDNESGATIGSSNDTPRIQNSSPTSAGFIDWDGDGNFDLFLSGRMESYGTQLGVYYHNENGLLVKDAFSSGGSASTIAFPDWDGDGIPDYFNSGFSTDDISFDSNFKGCRSTVYLNTTAKISSIASPENLTAHGKAGEVILSWEASMGTANNTTYEVYVKDSSGNLLTQTLAFVGGELDGVRKVMQMGRQGCNHSLKLSLPEGDYSWGVQAVNARYEGSRFAVGHFFVNKDAVTSIRGICRERRVKARYDIMGRQLSSSAKGFVLTKYTDGTVKKEVIRY